MILIGSNPEATPRGRDRLSAYTNYMRGQDPKKWHVHVPQFNQVWYTGIYPGIDLVYYASGGQPEYDFVVSPGAHPEVIGFSIEGVDESVRSVVSPTGDLVLTGTRVGPVLRKPLIYQGSGCVVGSSGEGSPSRPNSRCSLLAGGKFVLKQRNSTSALQVGFDLPQYDRTEPLVIDPAFSFSTYFGGSISDGANAMTIDSSGNIYLFGGTNSPDFPLTPGAFQTSLSGMGDLYVSKFSSDGSKLIYSTLLGGNGPDEARAIAVDSSGNAYLASQTFSTDFPIVNAFQPTAIVPSVVLSKLSPDGSALIFSTYVGNGTQPSGIAVDNGGEAIVTGIAGAGAIPIVNALQPVHGADGGYFDGFITKFDSSGAALVFSTYWGGNSSDFLAGVALDPQGNIYVAGLAPSTDFPVTPGAFETTCVIALGTCHGSFVSKFSPSGTTLLYSTYLDGGEVDAVAADPAGEAIVTGRVGESTGFPITPGSFQTVQGGGASLDAFVTKFRSDGSGLIYSTFLGGSSFDYGNAILADATGNAYLAGDTQSPNFPVQNPLQANYAGQFDAFVSELDSSGSQLVFSTYLGGGSGGFGNEHADGVALDASGNIYVAGFTDAADFPTVNAFQPQLRGFTNAFMSKIVQGPDFVISAPSDFATVNAGGKATYSLSVTPVNGFNQSVNLSCAGAPSGATCRVSPNSVALDGIHSAPATVTVSTTGSSVAALSMMSDPTRPSDKRSNGLGGVARMLKLVVFLGFPLGASVGKGRRRWRSILAVFAVFCAFFFLASCGGGGSGGGGGNQGPPTPSGTYPITVTGSAVSSQGTLSHPAQLTLVVN